MAILTASEARANFYRLIDETNINHEPTLIKGKRHSVVLVAEDDWRSLQETIHLLSIPGMRDSIYQGIREPLEKSDTSLNWS
ncbi:MAG: type II toxin-antitoxin system Phd/YefM family antitoxin [Alphaproteobacteria bacterium]|nr:type II toxin-antitoxin system Phd/YefM family antitoxin [Alphaproteobacteria bacterium]